MRSYGANFIGQLPTPNSGASTNSFCPLSPLSDARRKGGEFFVSDKSKSHPRPGGFLIHEENLCSLNEVRAKAGSANIHLPHATFRLDLNGLDVCLPDAIASSMRMAHVISEVSGLFANSTLCHGNTSYLLWVLCLQSPYRS